MFPFPIYLEDQFVGSGVLGDGESGSKVLSQKFSLLDGGKEGSVDFSLDLSSLGNSGLFFFSLLFMS